MKAIDQIVISIIMAICFTWMVYNTKAQAATFTAPPEFMAEYKDDWKWLEHQILISQDSEIIINWEGTGGDDPIAFAFIKTLRQAALQGKKVIIKVVGESISWHAMILCYADHYEFKRSKLVFHAGFDRVVNHRKIYESTDTDYRMLRPCLDKGFLNDYDMAIITMNHKRIEVYPNGKKRILEDWKE